MHSYEEHNPNLAERVARDSDFGFSGSKCYRKSTWHIRKGADNLLCSDAKDDCKTIKEEGKCSQNVGGCAGTPPDPHSPPLPLALLTGGRVPTSHLRQLREGTGAHGADCAADHRIPAGPRPADLVHRPDPL